MQVLMIAKKLFSGESHVCSALGTDIVSEEQFYIIMALNIPFMFGLSKRTIVAILTRDSFKQW